MKSPLKVNLGDLGEVAVSHSCSYASWRVCTNQVAWKPSLMRCRFWLVSALAYFCSVDGMTTCLVFALIITCATEIWLWQCQLLPLHWEITRAFAKEKWINEARRKLPATHFALLLFVFKRWNVKDNTQPKKINTEKKKKKRKKRTLITCAHRKRLYVAPLQCFLPFLLQCIYVQYYENTQLTVCASRKFIFIFYALQNIHINWILKWAQIFTE